MAQVKVDMDMSDFREMERDADAPTVKMLLALEAVLSETFLLTQSTVHVITGALKASGRATSESHGDTWTATITYDVDYAWYENRREGTKHGTSHEFMAPAFDTMGEEMKKAIEATWIGH